MSRFVRIVCSAVTSVVNSDVAVAACAVLSVRSFVKRATLAATMSATVGAVPADDCADSMEAAAAMSAAAVNNFFMKKRSDSFRLL